MEVLIQFLKDRGEKSDIITALEAQLKEPSEDFDLKKLVEQSKTSAEDLWVAQNKQLIINEYEASTKEEKYLSAIMPIQNKLIQLGGFTKEEIEGKKVKEIIELLKTKQEKLITESAGKGQEENLQKILELQNLNQEWEQKFTNRETELLTEIETEKGRLESGIKDFKTNSFLNEMYHDEKVIKWDDPNKVGSIYGRLLTPFIKENYNVDPDGKTIASKDGTTKPTYKKKDGTSVLVESLGHVINLWAADNSALKVSNGGQKADGDQTLLSTQQKIGEKVIDQSAASSLAKSLGM